MRKKFVVTSLVVALSVSTLFGCSESNNKEQETTQTAAESTESTEIGRASCRERV
mgnify:CR=1 FL=1